MSENILVVDDDAKVRKLLRNCFEPEGYQVYEAKSGAEIDATLRDTHIDLITLDLKLGAENGLSIASDIRSRCDTPIIIVTGKGDVIDKVVGLEMGADDYIAKPFHVREVIARVRSVIRRSAITRDKSDESDPPSPCENKTYSFANWVADPGTFELIDDTGELAELTTADFKLLMVLLKRPKQVLSRDQIMDQVNGVSWSPYDRTIDNQIARLRKKIEKDPAKPKFIKTVRGVGYTFASDVAVTEKST